MRRVAAFDAEAITRGAFGSSQPVNAPLISAIESEDPLRRLSFKQVYLRGIELGAQAMEFREDAIYDVEILTKRMTDFARRGEAVSEISDWSIREAARYGSRELLSYLYRVLVSLGSFPDRCVRTLAEYPVEAAAALALYSALVKN